MGDFRKISLPTLFGIGSLTFGAVVLEVSLTRVFSVAQGYYFAFLVISIALLGIGAAGSLLMAGGDLPILRAEDKIGGASKKAGGVTNQSILTGAAALFSVSVLLTYGLINIIPFDINRIAVDMRQPLFLFSAYLLLSIPFFFSGFAVAFIILRNPKSVGRIYFTDLLGAGLGGVSALLFLSIKGGVGGVITASLFGAISALLFSQRRGVFAIWALSLILLFISPPDFFDVRMSPYKELSLALRYPDAKNETFYNAISRVDIVSSGAVRTAPGLSLKYMRGLPPQVGVTTDGEGLFAITKGKGKGKEWDFLEYIPSSVPYYLRENKKVLVLESKGGLDVAQALHFSAEEVDLIEANPLLVKIVKDEMRGFTDGLFYDPRVTITTGSPREVLADTKGQYDLIVISGPATLGASGMGTGGIGENYDLTTEAMILYLSHLKSGGYISATRYIIPPPRDELRLLSCGAESLRRIGIDPKKSILALRSWGTITYILKKGELTEGEIAAFKKFAKDRSFDTAYFPKIEKSDINIYNRFPEPIYEEYIGEIISEGNAEAFYESYLFDVTPTLDNKPFYYQFFKNDRTRETYNAVDKKWSILLEGGYLVWVVFLQGVILSLMLIILPVFIKRGAVKTRDLVILYPFLAIGLSFIFLEISLIKRFILFLGQPAISVSAVITSLLASAGAGSLVSGKIKRISPKRLFVLSLIFVSVMILIYKFTIQPLLTSLISLSLPIKYITSAVIIAPLGFAMGFPFPSAIRFLDGERKGGLIPWAWCINGTASVVGSPLSVILALSFGFTWVMMISAGLYLSGLLFILGRGRGAFNLNFK